MALPQITPEALRILADYIYNVSGIVLDETKGYLAESRLGPLVAELGCGDYVGLCRQAQADTNRRIQARIIDAISTNETSFFRDNTPFDLFKFKILPDHIDRLNGRPGMLNIWSAACSTGQELYSIAIALKEMLPQFSQWRIRLLGTDISEAAVAQASAGRYNQIEIQRGLPEGKRTSYFNIQNNQWCIKDELRAIATFRQLNLLESFTALGKFDIIFCRNVAIYFNPETRKNLFDRLADQLAPAGALVIGSTESLIGISDRFERHEYHNAIYYSLRTS